jgi:hypothetical protein
MVNFALAECELFGRAPGSLRRQSRTGSWEFRAFSCLREALPVFKRATNPLNKHTKQMIDSGRSVLGEWLAEYLAGQINARAMTRAEAVSQIHASLERVKQTSAQSASEAEKTAAAMIAALPRDPL